MKIKFKEITLHHFLSFEEDHIQLNDRGYCLVSGVNKNPSDAASSNGSGKSSIWNAICWVLTGETIQGVHTGISNIHYNDGCWAELKFSIDSHEYDLTRSKDDKEKGNNLKIVIDGVDKSGKGIRESQDLLTQYLPDITSDLIGSVIILGQGLPHKFSDNTPSGRKELLEKLSKSDFMIEDLKTRLNNRMSSLGTKQREKEDLLLTLNTQQSLYNTQLINQQAALTQLETKPDFDNNIKNYRDKLCFLNKSLIEKMGELHKASDEVQKCFKEYDDLSKEESASVSRIAAEHNKVYKELEYNYTSLIANKNSLQLEIVKLKNITDICPTCGQHIPGIFKPDTTAKEKELKDLEISIEKAHKEITEDQEDFNDAEHRINEKFNSDIEEKKELWRNSIVDKDSISNQYNDLIKEQAKIETSLKIEEKDRDSYLEKKKNVEQEVEKLKANIEDNLVKSNSAVKDKENISKHLEAISSMMTLVKRDFRGFLLINVIDFINKKSKEYCKFVFDTDNIEINLDGNNINISFCDKDYENLSGGEKQKVDLVLQFAIRDMMCTYLNFSSNILVLDEIFDNLDNIGCDRVLNLISKELKDTESVFIISHHANELAIPYDYEIVVEKNDKGISHIR